MIDERLLRLWIGLDSIQFTTFDSLHLLLENQSTLARDILSTFKILVLYIIFVVPLWAQVVMYYPRIDHFPLTNARTIQSVNAIASNCSAFIFLVHTHIHHNSQHSQRNSTGSLFYLFLTINTHTSQQFPFFCSAKLKLKMMAIRTRRTAAAAAT